VTRRRRGRTNNGENRDWGLDDPHERPVEAVHETRDEIEDGVGALFDERPSNTPSAE